MSTGASCAARLTAAVVGLVLTPYLLRELGSEQFGLYALSLGLVSWLSALDLGTVPGLRVLLARDSGRLDSAGITRTVSSATAGQAGLALLTLAAGGALAWAAPWLAGDTLLASDASRTLIWLLAAGSAVSVGGQALAGALEAHQMGYVERGVRMLRTVVRLVVTVALLEAGAGLAALGWAHLAAALCGLFALVAGTMHKLPELRLNSRAVRWAALRETARPGIWLTVGAVAGLMIAAADRLVVARWFSLEAVAVLSVSAALFLLAESLLTFLLDGARPLLAQSLGDGRTDDAAALYQRTAQATAVLAATAAATVLAVNRGFVAAWAGPEHYGGWALDLALAAAMLSQVWTLPHRAALAASLDVRRPTAVRLAESALNLPLSIAMVRVLGLAGVMWGTAAAALATSAWALPRMAGRKLGIDARATWRPVERSTWCALILFPAAWRLREFEFGGYVGTALTAALMALAALPLIWFFGFDREVRRRLRLPVAWAS